MDPRFGPHNTHRQEPSRFAELDPQLRRLARAPRIWRPPLLDRLPREVPGIYTLGGGRQVGKTTLLKQWMHALLADGVAPERIAFVTGELIDDHHGLVAILQELGPAPGAPLTYLLVDEVTYIRDWDQGIKYLADAGLLDDVVLVLTGSDLAVIREARARLPGRRGVADVVDFHLHPLSFGATLRLKGATDAVEACLGGEGPVAPKTVDALHAALREYLVHGGYLTAINDLAGGGLQPATLRIYGDWLRGDVMKRGRSEHNLREVLAAIDRRLGSQVTWNALARELSIEHPKTVQDYVELLVSLDAVFVQPALLEHRLAAAPKKARKVMFSDPFVHHAAIHWLRPSAQPLRDAVQPFVDDPERASHLLEAVVATHFRRVLPTYYIKGGAGEVDVAVVDGGGFEPIEVKWRAQLRRGDLKQIRRYDNGCVWAPVREARSLDGVPVRPLEVELVRLERRGVLD